MKMQTTTNLTVGMTKKIQKVLKYFSHVLKTGDTFKLYKTLEDLISFEMTKLQSN